MQYRPDGKSVGVERRGHNGRKVILVPAVRETPVWQGQHIGALRKHELVRLGRDELGMSPAECNSNIPHVHLVEAVGEAIAEYHREREGFFGR